MKNVFYLIVALSVLAFCAPSHLSCQMIVQDNDDEPFWTMGVPWEHEFFTVARKPIHDSVKAGQPNQKADELDQNWGIPSPILNLQIRLRRLF